MRRMLREGRWGWMAWGAGASLLLCTGAVWRGPADVSWAYMLGKGSIEILAAAFLGFAAHRSLEPVSGPWVRWTATAVALLSALAVFSIAESGIERAVFGRALVSTELPTVLSMATGLLLASWTRRSVALSVR